jgi:hypothetical protein
MVGDGSSRDPHSADLADLIESVVDYDDPSELWDEVRQWLRAHGVDEITAAAERKDESDATVLHVACRECAPADVVEVMLVAAPDMAFWSDSSGWLPVRLLRFLVLYVRVRVRVRVSFGPSSCCIPSDSRPLTNFVAPHPFAMRAIFVFRKRAP